MADRSHRRKTELQPAIATHHHQTDLIEAVVPMLDRTVTITEVGADAIDALSNGEHRATLMLVAGPEPGQVYTLAAEATIGRDLAAEIRIDDSAVSRRHARVFADAAGYVIEDLGSSNGTLVGGTKITRCQLVDGDRVQLGPRVVLRFALLDEAEERMQRELFESSTRDPLTRAYNKKYITERLAAELAYARRHNSSLELVVLDVDHFKSVNDRYGHLVGDAVLRAIADRVHALIRSEDVFGRFGGEEFVLLSRSSDAVKLAERLRIAIAQLAIPTSQDDLLVTVSLGVARLDEVDDDADGSRLLQAADQRLLRAKREGRNQTCAND